jgi:hypothetical protein
MNCGLPARSIAAEKTVRAIANGEIADSSPAAMFEKEEGADGK